MSPTAQLAARDFARLAGEGLSTLYFERFLRDGWPSSKDPRRRRLTGLTDWAGLSTLRQSVRRVVAASAEAPVLFATRAAAWHHVATRWLSTRCHNVLTTDTLWPPYRAHLEDALRGRGGRLTVLPVREGVLLGSQSRTWLLAQLTRAYVNNACDGVFLSAVSHDGIRLPTGDILSGIRSAAPVRGAVIDAAQELAHVPVDLSAATCDFYFAGCHKWLAAYQTLGIALLPNPHSALEILAMLNDEQVEDPLLRFLLSIEQSSKIDSLETVNLSPLLTAWGALVDFHRRPTPHRARFRERLANATRVSALTRPLGWNASRPAAGLSSGILLLNSEDHEHRRIPVDVLQGAIDSAGVTLTAYREACLRLSLPDRPLHAGELRRLRHALDPRRLSVFRPGHSLGV